MTTPTIEQIVEEFDKLFVGNTELDIVPVTPAEDIRDWFRTTLTTYGAAREAKVREEERERCTEVVHDLLEQLADIEHQRWADWQSYLHSRGIESTEGEGYLCLPMGLVKNWKRQIATPYAELTESEKESDREQVRRYLPLIVRALTPPPQTDKTESV